jgi:pimeloyl-ACP methyl ester carboxylesterase
VLEASGVEGPYVLVGASFGGMIVTYYASQYPDEADGVVLLDVPAPTDELTLKEIPEIAWDHPENPEHFDIIPEFEGRFARNPVPFDAPLIVVTATNGQSSVKDQRFWLKLSPNAEQVELNGGHDIWLDGASP